VVFISTDYVFGARGARAAAYTEGDLPGPINVYGASKLAGEHLTAAHNPRHYIVRTSGLYGHAGARCKGGNFVETMRRLAGAGRPIRVVNDQRLSPTATRELTDRVLQLLETREYGVFHIAARDHCTWYEFAAAIFAELDAPVDLEPIPSSAYPQPARRPAMSALTSIRLPALQLAPCPAWRQMLTAYLEQPSDVQIAH
jgi:dTDP-4-dehydrorhamnose reductase